MKLNRKTIKVLKSALVIGILNRLNSEAGLEFIWSGEISRLSAADKKVFHMSERPNRLQDLTLPSPLGGYEEWSRVSLASELAKRQVRDMFPGQERFITWAWYN